MNKEPLKNIKKAITNFKMSMWHLRTNGFVSFLISVDGSPFVSYRSILLNEGIKIGQN